MVTDSPMTDLLCLVDAYASSHSSGDSNIKSCIWNTCLARRLQGSFHMGLGSSFSALDVREELRARAVLECRINVEPCLVDDDSNSRENSKPSHDEDSYILHIDGFEEKKDKFMSENPLSSEKGDSGLRQRKNKTSSISTTQVWEEENHDDDESKKLRKADPIELFGVLSPPALKVAQTKAREALASYIEAANLAAAIMRLTGAKDKETS